MFTQCLEKQNALREQFSTCSSKEEKYQKIIELGKQQPKLESQYKIEANVVPGCQSIMYLHSCMKDGNMIFNVDSDALISAGLAAILILVYSGEKPETVLKCEPAILTDLGIQASLTPSRANGLFSIYLRMKQDALKALVGKL